MKKNNSRRITLEQMEQRIKERFPTESFTIIHYETTGKPGIIRCNECNKEIKVSKMSNFFAPTKAYGCVECHGLHKERNKKLEKIKELYDILDDTEVRNTHKYYTIKCKKCGHIRRSSLKNIWNHLDCGCFSGVFRNRTAEEFIEEVNANALEGSYELIGEYKNQIEKVKVRHSCGFIWDVRPSDILHGRSFCPRCASFESKGAKKVRKILEAAKVDFQQEARVGDTLLRFDFYIDSLKVAIEFNGKQHYEEIPFFNSSLEEYVERDIRKKKYCLENNIELIVIPYFYTDEQIKECLLPLINKFNDYSQKEVESSDSK